MTTRNRARFRVGGMLFGLLLMLLTPLTATAHAELETSTPAGGASVESPFDSPIVLDFTEALADGSEADLLGPDRATVATADVDGPAARMTFELAVALAPGEYEVRWTAVALDGHVDRGTFSFTVLPAPSTPEPTPEPTPSATASAPATAETSAPASVAPTASPSASPEADSKASGAGDVLLPIFVTLIVAALGAVYLLSRRTRTTLP